MKMDVFNTMNVFSENKCKERFIKDCLDFERNEYALGMWKAAESVADFRKKYLENADLEIKLSQAYAEISKIEYETHENRIREMFGNRTIDVFARHGRIRIGTDDFKFELYSGADIRHSEIAVFEIDDRKNFNESMLNNDPATLNGTFNIYGANNEILATLNGKYFAYAAFGFVACVEWN